MEAGLITDIANGADGSPLKSVEADAAPKPAGDPDKQLEFILHRLDEDQAQSVVTIDLAGKTEVADAMVIASGRSHRHVAALADKLQRALKEEGYGAPRIEGLPSADWVLLDTGDLVVHLFRPEVRDFYKLERLWAPENFTEGEAPDPKAYMPTTDAIEVAESEFDGPIDGPGPA